MRCYSSRGILRFGGKRAFKASYSHLPMAAKQCEAGRNILPFLGLHSPRASDQAII